jgi:hypothetical protein
VIVWWYYRLLGCGGYGFLGELKMTRVSFWIRYSGSTASNGLSNPQADMKMNEMV